MDTPPDTRREGDGDGDRDAVPSPRSPHGSSGGVIDQRHSDLMDLFVPIPIQCSNLQRSQLETIEDGSEELLYEDITPEIRIVHLSPDRVPLRAPRYDMTLVVDLDETLVDARGPGVSMRPFARQFLSMLRSNLPRVEVIAWTAGIDVHARRVARLFESDRLAFARTGGRAFDFIVARGPDWYPIGEAPHKDIFRLRGRSNTTLILDDSVHASFRSGPNALIISPFSAAEYREASDSEDPDVALVCALQVVAFVHHIIASRRSRRPSECYTQTEPENRGTSQAADIVRTIVLGGFDPPPGSSGEVGGISTEAIVARALRAHPFVGWQTERSIECDKCETRPVGHFTLHTSLDQIATKFSTQYGAVIQDIRQHVRSSESDSASPNLSENSSQGE